MFPTAVNALASTRLGPQRGTSQRAALRRSAPQSTLRLPRYSVRASYLRHRAFVPIRPRRHVLQRQKLRRHRLILLAPFGGPITNPILVLTQPMRTPHRERMRGVFIMAATRGVRAGQDQPAVGIVLALETAERLAIDRMRRHRG